MVIISTPRLLLRGALPEDFDVLFATVFSDARVAEHLSGAAMSRDQARQFFDQEFDHLGTGRKIGVLVEKGSSALVGYAGLKPFKALGREDYEVGFVLNARSWGRGYATEIGRAQLEYGFATTELPRLVAQVRPENLGSAKALAKIGMNYLQTYDRPNLGIWDIYVCPRPVSS